MSRYKEYNTEDLEQFLLEKGFSTKNLSKTFMTSFLNYLDNGKITILPSEENSAYIEKIQLLQERIFELEDVNNCMDNSIQRLKTGNDTLKSLAIDSEEALNAKIEEQERLIISLKTELTSISAQKPPISFEPCDECSNLTSDLLKLKKMLDIKTLEIRDFLDKVENQEKKISKLQQELKDSYKPENIISSNNDTKTTSDKNVVRNSCSVVKNRVLILADSQGRNLGSLWKSSLNENHYNSICICKPNAEFENVAESALNMAKDFTKNDLVILFAGSNNALNQKPLSRTFLQSLSDNLAHTKVVIILSPLWHNNISVNSFILRNNLTLYSIFKDCPNVTIINPAHILNPTDFTRHGLHINLRGKRKLVNHINSFTLLPLQTSTSQATTNSSGKQASFLDSVKKI